MAIQAAKLMVEVGADTRDAQKGVDDFSGKLNRAAKNLTSTGLGLSAAITAPLIGIAAAALDSAGGFEQSMNVLQEVTGASEGVMASMRDEALRLGAVTVFSAGEAADAMLELGKAGLDTNEIMASIGGVLDLAAAGGVGLAEAAGITAAALNAFGLEASESTRIANLLAAGANASAADITDLSQGLKQAGFAFSLANQPIESLVASLAILTNVGLTGSDAGTALKNAFTRMINPTAEAAALMKDLGISFYDASGTMRQLPDIIDIINVATSSLTDEQRNAALATIFLSDGMKAMVPLLNVGGEGFNAMVTEVTKAGAATEVANARMSGLRGGIEYLKGSLDSFLIGAALPFLDTLGGIARGAGDAISAFGALPPSVMSATLAFAGVLAAAGPLLLVLGGLSRALAFLISPLGLAMVASAALAAAWAADLGGIQGKTAEVFAAVQTWFASTATSAQALAGSIAAAFGNTQFPSLQTLWEQFKAGDFQTVADTIRNTAFDLMVNLDTELSISAQARSLDAELRRRSNLVDQFAADAITGWTESITNIDWSGLSLNAANIVSAVSLGLKTVDWSGLTSLFLTGFNSATPKDPSAFQLATDNFGAAIRQAFMDIQWGDLGLSFLSLTLSITNSIVSMREALDDAVTTAMIGFFAGIRDRALGFFSGSSFQFDPVITKGPDPILSQQKNLLNPLSNAASTMFAEFYAAFTASAASTARQMVASVGSFFTGLGTSFLTGIASLGTQLKDAISGMLSKLNPFAADEGVKGPKGRYSLRPPTSDQPDIGAFDWVDFIAPLEWPSFISILRWETFVERIDWGGFIDNVEWSSIIPDFSWGDWVPSLDWTRFIPSLWGGAPAQNATGTNYFGGGLSWVGERGPELVSLPRGSRIYNNQDSMAMAGSGITVQINIDRVGSDMDVESIANRVVRKIQQRVR